MPVRTDLSRLGALLRSKWPPRRRFHLHHEAELAAHLASTPPPAAAKPAPEPEPPVAPWAAYEPPRDEPIEDWMFYGPDPDSEDGRESARILQNRVATQLREALHREQMRANPQRSVRVSTDSAERVLSVLDEQRRSMHRKATDEPPRMYVIQRLHLKSGLIELLTMSDTWTVELDLNSIVIDQAHRLSKPEDDEHYSYSLIPFDTLLFEARRALDDEMLERAFVHLERTI